MTVAAWCRGCGRYVWLNDQWACEAGHGWNEMSQWYDPDTGAPVIPYWLQPQPAPSAEEMSTPAAATAAPAAEPTAAAPAVAQAPAPPADPAPMAGGTGTREAVLTGVMAAFADKPGYRAQYGTDTDVMIDNVVADAAWGTGAKKVDYEAVLKAVEAERTVYFWEMLKEKGGGLSFGGFESESYSTFGKKRSGTKKEVVLGPGGKAMDYTWDYSATRQMVEEVAQRNGWRLKVVLRKKSAQW